MKKILFLLSITLTIILISTCSLGGNLLDEVQVADPEITVDSSESPALVTITSPTDNAEIYYTTDGTEPDPSSYPFGSTEKYLEPFYIYKPSSVKAIASKIGSDSSNIVQDQLDITPVSLAVGETHDFNGLEVTLNNIFWYAYEDYYGNTITTDNIAFEFSVKNNTGRTLETDQVYSWGNLIELPSNNQLSELYHSSIYDTNMTVYSGDTVLDGSNIITSIHFEEISEDSTSFIFKGKPHFGYSVIQYDAGYYFEISFDRDEVATKPL